MILKPTNVVLSTYTGETVHPLGEAFVNVEYSGSQYSLPLLIVREGSCALFGRNWLVDVKLDWKNLPGQIQECCESNNLWKRHVDQRLSRPVYVAPPNNPLVIEDHSMPLEMAPAVDRSDEIVPPTSGVPTATSESHLTGTSEQFYSRSPLPRVSLPVTDNDNAIRVPPVSLLETTDSVNNALLDNPSSSCETSALPCSERRYPVRATRGLPSYLKDYELK